MNSLEAIFGELGISQYLDAFVDQGFDSWDTILDITESDLDALGVKLGHRRKLQRRIANYRGLAPDASLISPTRTSIEDVRLDSTRAEPVKSDKSDGATVAKRKYRRHPKPDENAPERPPSAYVLFSNKMREDLRGQNLTFTEIAKLVGENWQNLNRAEKEPFERQAHEAKEKYNRELSTYKKTNDFRKYSDYLHEFRKRQAAQLQEKDASKRLKTESDSTRGSSTSGGSTGPSGTTSGTGSGSDSQPGSEPPPTRQQRMGSSTSTVDSNFSPRMNGIHHGDEPLHSPRTLSYDEQINGRPRGLSSPTSRDSPSHHSSSRSRWLESQRMYAESNHTSASWFDPRNIQGSLAHSPESSLPTPVSSLGLSNGSARGSRSSASGSRPPSLKTEQSSAGSVSSYSSYNTPRTPSDASLPIHALLSSKPEPQYSSRQTTVSHAPLSILQSQPGRPPGDRLNGSMVETHGNGFLPGPIPPKYIIPSFQKEAVYGVPAEPKLTTTSKLNGSSENGLDGISALLKAREIVDRR
ncbi:hypothetical protein GGS23DRAFT_598201 [Durotheca rogersii]|uniref:uncharacterized protein n=1 Tax=Durotheca rogersii TaxID=419775 RepID=UPI0022202441|nr:uncharacterized protein GGS23DRAFT_601864 [Durotheca rogersii]XP_051370507.1 uncharacterized protein GGS23DRAFT_598201 [Durotheca rogersii]KAI5850154.1 hypothetical protein GGS23DRAFT_601864 [Durotheca rogersii]KAI5861797.1 hypothetical protein GGS23DRAFT_598201 [Durotheca rogersii]